MHRIHSFHVPVLGIGYSIDTPLKVARFGISSVVSIMDDEIIDSMRRYHCTQNDMTYVPIAAAEEDARTRRICDYLNIMRKIIGKQIDTMKKLPFAVGNDLAKFFVLLPSKHPFRKDFFRILCMPDGDEKNALAAKLRSFIKAGEIEVNIMAKVDNPRKSTSIQTKPFSDALSALRGFASSSINASLVLSAGYNPALFTYMEDFADFFPDENGKLEKRVILKVSDYRSAYVQGTILARKGIWVSEYRIESGLNCGGHAFPTDGILIGPILEEFKNKRKELQEELFQKCQLALKEKARIHFKAMPDMRVSYQGGVGTAEEHNYLLMNYKLDSIGWGSPFLLVPEVSNVDEKTLDELSNARPSDYFLSNASPLGLPFYNFRKSSAEKQRQERIDKNRPGSPCYKKFLVSDKEFSEEALCTASRLYQSKKIKQLQAMELPKEEYDKAYKKITDKDCLCEGLSASALLEKKLPASHKLSAVTICPGPNLSYFSGIFSLRDMLDHIYGRKNILNKENRPNLFIKEMQLYLSYFRDHIEAAHNGKAENAIERFRKNLQSGIEYYRQRIDELSSALNNSRESLKQALEEAELAISKAEYAF